MLPEVKKAIADLAENLYWSPGICECHRNRPIDLEKARRLVDELALLLNIPSSPEVKP